MLVGLLDFAHEVNVNTIKNISFLFCFEPAFQVINECTSCSLLIYIIFFACVFASLVCMHG